MHPRDEVSAGAGVGGCTCGDVGQVSGTQWAGPGFRPSLAQTHCATSDPWAPASWPVRVLVSFWRRGSGDGLDRICETWPWGFRCGLAERH